MSDHPITPPPELVQQWIREKDGLELVVARAAQWGADTELEACCEWIDASGSVFEYTDITKLGSNPRVYCHSNIAKLLRAARRPKPPSLKGQALVALNAIATGANDMREQLYDFDTIRRALEQLDD